MYTGTKSLHLVLKGTDLTEDHENSQNHWMVRESGGLNFRDDL